MQSYYRKSIDTFYFGLRFSDFDGNELVDQIKDYLSSMNFILSDSKIKSPYYHFTLKGEGITIAYDVRNHCQNDFCTIQLSGKFFQDIEFSHLFIDFLFRNYLEYINVQRVDVALDLIWSQYPDFPDDGITHLSGFPVPSYSETWDNVRIPFEYYGRSGEVLSDVSFINMIFQGKSDTRLRVYDKSLDLLEKYNEDSYLHYYGFDIFRDKVPDVDSAFYQEQVYRVEFQARGDKLKGFWSRLLASTDKVTYNYLVDEMLAYVFFKYSFAYITSSCFQYKGENTIYRFSPVKREKLLENIKEYHRRMIASHYNKYSSACDKIVASRRLDFEVAKASGHIQKANELAGKLGIDLYSEHEKMILSGNIDR